MDAAIAEWRAHHSRVYPQRPSRDDLDNAFGCGKYAGGNEHVYRVTDVEGIEDVVDAIVANVEEHNVEEEEQ